jgi:hypothetical protein
MKLNEQIKAAWLTALRSGDYKQGTGYLCQHGQHCCLGVLSQLAVEAGAAKAEVDGDRIRYTSPTDPHLGSMAMPPMAVARWAFGEQADSLTDYELDDLWRVRKAVSTEVHPYLTTLNDGGSTFAEIADLIESSL